MPDGTWRPWPAPPENKEEMIRLMRDSDVPAAMKLVEAAGWNQTPQDWRNVMEVEPEGCYVLECEEHVVATATTVCYGDRLAWIGMVLTDPAFRGRGFARQLMNASVDYCRRRDVALVKLDATDMGHPLYERLGFRDESVVERWLRPAGAAPMPVELPYEPMPDLDLAAFGVDRSSLIRRMLQFESASAPGEGYAIGRPGRVNAYFGPCVAGNAAAARRLLEWFLARHPEEGVFWDILEHNAHAAGLAREYGFEPRRRLLRMALRLRDGAPLGNDDTKVFGLAGFEYG